MPRPTAPVYSAPEVSKNSESSESSETIETSPWVSAPLFIRSLAYVFYASRHCRVVDAPSLVAYEGKTLHCSLVGDILTIGESADAVQSTRLAKIRDADARLDMAKQELFHHQSLRNKTKSSLESNTAGAISYEGTNPDLAKTYRYYAGQDKETLATQEDLVAKAQEAVDVIAHEILELSVPIVYPVRYEFDLREAR